MNANAFNHRLYLIYLVSYPQSFHRFGNPSGGIQCFDNVYNSKGAGLNNPRRLMKNMPTNTNILADLREKAGVSLQDVAYLINVDQAHLQKVEDGDRPASVTIILIYHMLFRAPLEDMYAELYAHLHALLLERSETLIANLERKQSPKSTYRIESISKIVNSLTHSDYDCVN